MCTVLICLNLYFQVDGGVDKKWTRSNSLRRPFHNSRHNNGHQQDPSAHSDTEIGKVCFCFVFSIFFKNFSLKYLMIACNHCIITC